MHFFLCWFVSCRFRYMCACGAVCSSPSPGTMMMRTCMTSRKDSQCEPVYRYHPCAHTLRSHCLSAIPGFRASKSFSVRGLLRGLCWRMAASEDSWPGPFVGVLFRDDRPVGQLSIIGRHDETTHRHQPQVVWIPRFGWYADSEPW